jgi:hypothetical protein
MSETKKAPPIKAVGSQLSARAVAEAELAAYFAAIRASERMTALIKVSQAISA